MHDHDEITTRFDDAIGDGPAHPPIDVRLSAGRSALRRRRAAVGVGALAMAAVVGGTAWLALPGSDPQVTQRDDAPAVADDRGVDASRPTLAPDRILYETRAPDAAELATMTAAREFIAFDATGKTLLVRPGFTVVRRIDKTRKGMPTVAAILRSRKGGLYKMFVRTDGWARAGATSPRELEAWIKTQLRNYPNAGATNTDDSDMPGTVDGSVYVKIVGESLAPVGETAILDQRSKPDLPDNFAKADDASWVAHVRDGSGAEWFVLVRTIAGTSDFMAVPAADADNPSTLDAFLEWARPRYESEVGVR